MTEFRRFPGEAAATNEALFLRRTSFKETFDERPLLTLLIVPALGTTAPPRRTSPRPPRPPRSRRSISRGTPSPPNGPNAATRSRRSASRPATRAGRTGGAATRSWSAPSTPKGFTVSNEIGDINSGDTHEFDPAVSCIISVRPGIATLGRNSVCDEAGKPGPFSFKVELWEKDISPFRRVLQCRRSAPRPAHRPALSRRPARRRLHRLARAVLPGPRPRSDAPERRRQLHRDRRAVPLPRRHRRLRRLGFRRLQLHLPHHPAPRRADRLPLGAPGGDGAQPISRTPATPSRPACGRSPHRSSARARSRPAPGWRRTRADPCWRRRTDHPDADPTNVRTVMAAIER